MFNGFHNPIPPSDAEIATQTLNEESSYRFPAFSANEAVTLGLSIRKRFRASSRHAKGKGMVLSIQSIAGHTLFACTVGDLGGISGVGDVSLDSWACLEGMISVVKRTGHSSYYVEKGMAAMGKTPSQMGIQGDYRICGGAFPIWLDNAPCCPIAVVGCYSGSSADDHHLVVNTVKDYIKKMTKDAAPQPPVTPPPATPPPPSSPSSRRTRTVISTSQRSHEAPPSETDRESLHWIAEPRASPLTQGMDYPNDYDRQWRSENGRLTYSDMQRDL